MKSQSNNQTHTITIEKSQHNNESGTYEVHFYGSNSSYLAEKLMGGINLYF